MRSYGQKSKWVTMSTVWNSIRQTHQAPPWVDAVWNTFAVPKSSFVFWLAIQRLLTKDRMVRFGLEMDKRCLLCGHGRESASHLLTCCTCTKEIFDKCPIRLNNNWSYYTQGNFLDSQATDASPGVKIRKNLTSLFIATAIYYI